MGKRNPRLTTLAQAAQTGEEQHILKAMSVSHRQTATAAKLLDIPLPELRRKLDRMGHKAPRAKHFDTLRQAVRRAECACIRRAMKTCRYRMKEAAEKLGLPEKELAVRCDFLRLQEGYLIDVGLVKRQILEAAWFHGGRNPAGMARFMDMELDHLTEFLRRDGRSQFDFPDEGPFVYKFILEPSIRLLGDPWPKTADGRHIKGYQKTILQIMLDEARPSLTKSKGDLVIAAFHLNISEQDLKAILEHNGYIVQDETFRRP
jgi:hypothetical protein